MPAFASMIAPGQNLLPSLAVDLPALYRHALGMLVRRGHRRLCWITPRDGGVETARFWPAFEPYRGREGFAARQLTHDGTPDDLRRVLESAMESSMRPTVLLVERPAHVLTVFSFLVTTGYRIPGDLSLLSIGYDPFLENLYPSLAYYAADQGGYVRKLLRVLLPWIRSGQHPASQPVVLPRFHEGPSIATLR